ncbi:unnamed protein product [Lepeophtheirus salmonis]|uniref:(salmon louse) hypothetical protein n=1 Tax=Lepeophtheirus salmonis TaxID=72036 RepID=A0A7R8CI04_LEPSM|nr:unnamed protein product [Lepeophtheirus salmonis]CAF2828122.1 unnamed protein product [Lepeophtheirus salmonis]
MYLRTQYPLFSVALDDEGGFRREVDSKKKSMSESDLLSVNNKADSGNSSGNANNNNNNRVSESIKADGYYRSFDDIDDIDLGVLASSNSLEAAVVLRHKQSPPGLRYSFNSSSDSGRTSDTYAETSNGSVTSSSSTTNHPNNVTQSRLYSSNSNCSGDSGTQCSMSSDSSNSKPGNLEVLKEQVSPIYPPFDQNIYGQSIAIKNIPPSSPPPLPPRFATVRKSFTLPHNINAISESINNHHHHSSGTESNKVNESIYTTNNTYENLELNTPRQRKQNGVPRPQSLIFNGNASMGRLKNIPDNNNKQQPLNRTLARLSGLDSAPSTPEYIQQESPRLARFLGLTPNSLSSSTPMDLESRMSSCESLSQTKIGRMMKHPRWQSNDGLMTPGSLQCTPNGSPCRAITPTPMRLLKNPLTVAGLAGPNHLLINSSQGPSQPNGPSSTSSMFSLSSPSHHRLITPQYRTPHHHTGPRFMPRSATLDNLEAPYASWRRGDSVKSNVKSNNPQRNIILSDPR